MDSLTASYERGAGQGYKARCGQGYKARCGQGSQNNNSHK